MTHPQVALVTGAARRVGRAVAQRLAEAGFDIVLTYLNSGQEARQLVGELEAGGRRALAIRADLAQPQEAADLIHRGVAERFGRLDVLVNNASLYEPDTLSAADLTLTRRLQAIHVESPLLLCQRFERFLRDAHGHIVNLVDLLAERPWPQYLSYCASKAALANLTLSLAASFAPDVTVNGIAPGVVQWPENYPQAEREKYLRRVPLARPGTPQDVAELVHFLCSGGSYITGQILRLDGGRSIT